jgi:hypothetical protein
MVLSWADPFIEKMFWGEENFQANPANFEQKKGTG